MEYTECTHCGKRYTVNEHIRSLEGRPTRCKACNEKFTLTIYDSEKQKVEVEDADLNTTGEWDPSLTMPEAEELDVSSFGEEGAEEQAEAVLEEAQKAKKKQQLLYAGLGLGVVLLALVLYTTLMGDDSQAEQPVFTPAAAPLAKKQSAEDIDKNNPKCREAAAKQWLIDYRAMYADYSAETFVEILKQSDTQMAIVTEHCGSSKLSKSIIASVTAQEKPEWFAAEIKAFQK